MKRRFHQVAQRAMLLTLIAVAASAATAADPKAAQFYEDGLSRFEKKDNKGAILQLKNAIRIDRKMLQAQVLMGRALLANGEINAAEVAFDEALKLGVRPAEVVLPLAETVMAQGKPDQLLDQPRFSPEGLAPDVKGRLLLLKAAAASDLGRTRDALALLDQARALDSNSAESWTAEVPIRVRLRQLAEAQTAADKAVAIDPKSVRASYQQATVAHVKGDLKTALALYTRTLELQADHADALVARAGIYIDLGQADKAVPDVQAARKKDPQDARAVFLTAMLAERNGDKPLNKKSLNEVANLLDPLPIDFLRYRPQLLLLGGMSHFGLEQYEKAKPYLEMILRQDKNSPVSKLLAQVYLRDKRADKAVEALDAYLRVHPGDAQAKTLLASANMAQGRYARSVKLMDEALKKSDDPAMRAMLGVSLMRSGNFSDGAQELETALQKDPGNVQAGTALAGLYIASGQGTKASAVAQGLVQRQPKNAGLVSLLGSALAAKGDAAGARKAFEQALQLDPKFAEPALNLARLDIDERAFDAALPRLNALLAKDEKNVDVAMEVARLFSARGNAEESQRWLQRADDNSGQRLQPGLQLIDFHLARGRGDLAREPLKRLQGKAPDALPVLLAQARIQLANAEPNEAKATLNRAATGASADAAALAQIAELQLRAGDAPGAAQALDNALQAKPNHLRARALRANVYLLQGDAAKSEQLARSIVASDSKLGMGYALLGDVARQRNQGAAAVEAYKRAQQVEPSSSGLLRVFNAMEPTQRGAAVTLAEQWLRTHADDTLVLRAVGDAQARAGDMASARNAYERVVKASPKDAEAMNNLAVVMVSLGDPAAVKVADQALALKPQTPHILGTAGWAAFHAKQPERALQLLREARLRDPNNAATRYYLGTVLAQQGRNAEAKTELQSALDSGPNFAYAKDTTAALKTLR